MKSMVLKCKNSVTESTFSVGTKTNRHFTMGCFIYMISNHIVAFLMSKGAAELITEKSFTIGIKVSEYNLDVMQSLRSNSRLL